MINCFVTRMVQKRVLRKTVCSHRGRYIPLSSARRIAYMVNAAEPGAAEAVNYLHKIFSKNGIEHLAVCMDLRKEPQDTEAFTSVPDILMIVRENVNWYGLPQEDTMSAIMRQPFDILIDLTCREELFTADYLLRKASASFRIGTSGRPSGIYDMTVTGDGQDYPADRLAKDIIHYLTSIHTYSK